MIVDANSIPAGTELRADLCIVGAGAAGISLALKASGRGLKVLLLESGRSGADSESQSLYEGETADENMHSPPDKYRQRRFGGSTGLWGGRCVPFDPIDFEARDYVPDSGWPISYEDVAPYYPEANELAEAGRFQYDADRIPGFEARPMIRGFRSDTVLTSGLERFSCPTDFAQRYERRLRTATDVEVVLGANCISIRLDKDGKQVRCLEMATLDGNRFSVVANSHVIATGGLETARLLLASRDVMPAGVGNQHDVVGRYYMCHIAGNLGTLTVNGHPENVRHGYEVTPDGIYARRRLSLVASEQRRLGVGNVVARLHFSRITDPRHRNGVLSGLFLARNLISYEYGKRLNDGTSFTLADYARHFRNVVTDPFDTTAFLLHWIGKRTLSERKYPSVILKNRTNRFSFEIHGEQTPLHGSRVTLADSVDRFGMPRLRLDWKYSKADIESVGRTLDRISTEFAQSGLAQFEYDRSRLEEDLMRFGAYGGHHVGTARMGTDVRKSVVDANCRVHGMENLFVAGSAVFPTSSQANPTLTIIAMALRLADHLCADGKGGLRHV